jgi:hypothetical protein
MTTIFPFIRMVSANVPGDDSGVLAIVDGGDLGILAVLAGVDLSVSANVAGGDMGVSTSCKLLRPPHAIRNTKTITARAAMMSSRVVCDLLDPFIICPLS